MLYNTVTVLYTTIDSLELKYEKLTAFTHGGRPVLDPEFKKDKVIVAVLSGKDIEILSVFGERISEQRYLDEAIKTVVAR